VFFTLNNNVSIAFIEWMSWISTIIKQPAKYPTVIASHLWMRSMLASAMIDLCARGGLEQDAAI